MKTKIDRSRFLPAVLALVLPAAAVLVLPPQLAAQQLPPGAGAQSQNGEAQPGQPLPDSSTAPRMPGGEPGKATIVAPRETLIDGKTLKMDAALARPQAAAGGEQPSLQAAKALKPSGGGGQKGRPVPEAAAGSHLQVVLRVTEGGKAEVMNAAEVPGPAPLTTEPLGDYVYEVTDGGSTLAVQALPDPFELRSFSPPGTNRGHHLERAKTTTVTIQVPLPRADAQADRIGLNLIKLEPGRTLEKVDATELARLKQENRARVLVAVPAAELAPQIRQKAVPLEKVVQPPQ